MAASKAEQLGGQRVLFLEGIHPGKLTPSVVFAYDRRQPSASAHHFAYEPSVSPVFHALLQSFTLEYPSLWNPAISPGVKE